MSAPPAGEIRGCRFPSSGTRRRVSRSLTASGSDSADLESGSAAPVDLRPGTKEDLQPLPGLLPACERDRVLPSRRVGHIRNQHPVRNDLVVAGQPPRRRVAGPLRDRETLVDPAREKAEHRHRAFHVPEVTRGVVRDDDRGRCHRESRDARHRRHRLVEMEDVETLAFENALDADDRARAEHDVRQRAIRGDDHRATDRDHVRRWIAVASDPRVEARVN